MQRHAETVHRVRRRTVVPHIVDDVHIEGVHMEAGQRDEQQQLQQQRQQMRRHHSGISQFMHGVCVSVCVCVVRGNVYACVCVCACNTLHQFGGLLGLMLGWLTFHLVGFCHFIGKSFCRVRVFGLCVCGSSALRSGIMGSNNLVTGIPKHTCGTRTHTPPPNGSRNSSTPHTYGHIKHRCFRGLLHFQLHIHLEALTCKNTYCTQ